MTFKKRPFFTAGLFLAGASLFLSCDPEPEQNHIREGLRPVYADSDTWRAISVMPPQAIHQLGKFATKDGYLFINERQQGIHIIDNRNPESPEPVRFLSIPGNTDFDFKGDVLYADNYTDLVAIRLSDDFSMEITERKQGLYSSDIPSYPADYSGYFECADPSKGLVIDWIEADLVNPKCRR